MGPWFDSLFQKKKRSMKKEVRSSLAAICESFDFWILKIPKRTLLSPDRML